MACPTQNAANGQGCDTAGGAKGDWVKFLVDMDMSIHH